MLYKLLLHCNNHLKSCSQVTRQRASVIKLGVVDIDVRISSHLKKSWIALYINHFRLLVRTIMLFKGFCVGRSKGKSVLY